MPLRTYGWTALIGPRLREALGELAWIIQGRAVVAARSKAEVGRIVGRPPRQLFNLGETGNAEEKAAAEARPGVVLVHSMNRPRGPYVVAKPEEVA